MSERLDAHVLEFRKGEAASFRVWPKRLGESEEGSGSGSGTEAVPGPGAVLSGPGEVALADVPQSGRVFRCIFCPGCGWQYGANWPRAEVYGYWGDCPHCGKVTSVRSRYVDARPEVSSSECASAGPAQQELGL